MACAILCLEGGGALVFSRRLLTEAIGGASAMVKRIDALVNPRMLVWARRTSGFDINGVAKRLRVEPEQVDAWESGAQHPTIRQALQLAEVYGRPLSALYLNEPPQDFSIAMTDFRRLPEPSRGQWSPALIREVRLATARREVMLDLANSQDAGVFEYLNSVTIEDNPDVVARQIRSIIGIDWPTQQRWHNPNQALNGWKEAIEHLDVLVFHSNHQGHALAPAEAHGFSLSERRFPVIVVNSRDAPRRRVFTLLHEFAHLLVDAGGICDMWEYAQVETPQQRTEVFCNRVAAEVLVPASLLLAHEVVRVHSDQPEWTDEEITALSEDFSASQEVIVRRLLALGLTTPTFYQQKRGEYLQAWIDYKRRDRGSSGERRPPYYRMVMRNNGKPLTRQVLHAYYDEQITLSDVSDYLGAKVKHVKRMEQDVFGIPC